MGYDYKRIEKLIKTEEDAKLAMDVRKEYTDAIDVLMGSSLEEDLGEFGIEMPPDPSKIESCAMEATTKRMHKHGKTFFEAEIERLMDKLNNKEYDKREYMIRCEVLKSITVSLIEFKPR